MKRETKEQTEIELRRAISGCRNNWTDELMEWNNRQTSISWIPVRAKNVI